MQFEDADEDAVHPTASTVSPPSDSLAHLSLFEPAQPPQPTSARAPGQYIDDAEPAAPAEGQPGQDELDEDDDYWDEDDEQEIEWERSLNGGLNEVMDQDWDVVSGDFTKRYNRMKQHVVATHASLGAHIGATSSHDPTLRPGNVVPAQNRPKPPPTSSLPTASGSASSSAAGVHLNKVSDQLAHYSQYASKISLAPLFPTNATTTKKGGSEKVLIKDKADRATVEQVLDPRTRLIIFKMINRELIERVDGCVSTGKEANVYHAVAPEGKHLALKIYKTSILVFKDRDRYVSGEFRFKSGYARSNPRKMVRLWAEKEMRNLRRMKTAGLRVPEAIEVRENVLVMEFMGQNGEWEASPRLKDAEIPPERLRSLYIEMLVILRTIFIRCRLVHADFSEYNVLYHDDHLWVIDVSQSVEQDHPAAFDFLRNDLRNCDDFFSKRGVDTLGLTRTFAYVTRKLGVNDREETDEEMEAEAERVLTEVENGEGEEEEEEEGEEAGEGERKDGKGKDNKPTESDEAVFAQSYIPRALDQVYDPERDVAKVLRGEGKGLIYADLTGVAKIQAERRAEEGGAIEEEEEEGSEDDDEDGESGSESGEEEDDGKKKPRGKKFEDKEEKKKRRQEVKEANREKRTKKMSKSEKARKVKKSSGKR
ncbi:RIO kinase 1 [Pseudohyphozyma bogoriensis]|nr:RIO kinase 1 [Pseudohyphozyma bogoriensis]